VRLFPLTLLGSWAMSVSWISGFLWIMTNLGNRLDAHIYLFYFIFCLISNNLVNKLAHFKYKNIKLHIIFYLNLGRYKLVFLSMKCGFKHDMNTDTSMSI
jgi:hypothetical protein